MCTSATESHAVRHKKPRDCIPPRGGGRTNHDRNLKHQGPAEDRLPLTFAADTSPRPARSRPSCCNTISNVTKTGTADVYTGGHNRHIPFRNCPPHEARGHNRNE